MVERTSRMVFRPNKRLLFLALAFASLLALAGTLLLVPQSSSAHTLAYSNSNTPPLSGQSITTPTVTPTCEAVGQVVPSPNAAGNNYLRAIDAVSANDIWAVGFYHNDGAPQTLVEHWDGSQWSVVPSPNVGLAGSNLFGVEAIAPDDVWAVGWSGNGDASQTLILHWNGFEWSVVPSPNSQLPSNILYSVSAVTPTDIWAVGYYYDDSAEQPLILHWNGSEWSVVPSLEPASYRNFLYAVDAVSANDVWAVGSAGGQTLTMHWNGSEWSIIPSPNAGGSEANFLHGVSAISAQDIWAVGYYDIGGNTFRTLTMRWNGSQWVLVPSPTPGIDASLYGVEAVGPNDVWAVGNYLPDSGGQRTLALRWNGSTWSVAPSPSVGFQRGVTAADGEVWSVGSYNVSGLRTLVERYTNECTTPTVTPLPTPATCSLRFNDVTEDSPFYEAIRCLACRGVVSGYSDGTFRPNNLVTRGQLAKIVSGAAGFNEDPGEQIYQDVPSTHPFYPWVNRLTRRGYMSGYPCGGPLEPCSIYQRPYFRPAANATRGQTSKIVANAANFNEPVSGQSFEDVPPIHPFYEWTQRLASRNVMQGYPCGGAGEPCGPGSRAYFRPFNGVTRGQSAKIVSNSFFPACNP